MRLAILGLLSLALTACPGPRDDADDSSDAGSTEDAGSTDAGSTDAGSDPVARAALVDAIIEAVCAREAACCANNETVASCNERLRSAAEPLATNLSAVASA